VGLKLTISDQYFQVGMRKIGGLITQFLLSLYLDISFTGDTLYLLLGMGSWSKTQGGPAGVSSEQDPGTRKGRNEWDSRSHSLKISQLSFIVKEMPSSRS
jgi:hypothetical protein